MHHCYEPIQCLSPQRRIQVRNPRCYLNRSAGGTPRPDHDRAGLLLTSPSCPKKREAYRHEYFILSPVANRKTFVAVGIWCAIDSTRILIHAVRYNILRLPFTSHRSVRFSQISNKPKLGDGF